MKNLLFSATVLPTAVSVTEVSNSGVVDEDKQNKQGKRKDGSYLHRAGRRGSEMLLQHARQSNKGNLRKRLAPAYKLVYLQAGGVKFEPWSGIVRLLEVTIVL